jgi:fructose-1,6-bisphosphatase II
VTDITVMMLDRDRHEEAKAAIRRVGARLQLIPDGDVAGAILAAWEERPQVDVLYGIGGHPEGVTSACAVKALGGQILGRLWARSDAEAAQAREAGYDLDRSSPSTTSSPPRTRSSPAPGSRTASCSRACSSTASVRSRSRS